MGLETFKNILRNEVDLLQQLDHPNIIRLVDFHLEGELVVKKSGKCIQIFFIVLELVELGDLFSFIKVKNQTGAFPEPFARHFFKQLLKTLEYLHREADIVHRDLKPENLLLNSNYDLKIADFGLSASRHGVEGTGIHYSHVGTRQYQAPEVLEKRHYSGESVDVFSIGVILFLMVTGALPYLGQASKSDPIY
jgi:carbon catabolite-derepressing protein kinase